ncbi:hypothetical protein ACROYT_G028604 [Oculina patagonica]
MSCWKEFLEADDSILSFLGNLGREEQPDVEIKSGIEKFLCQIYVPKTDLTTVKELRWSLFKKKQAESDRLPPTQAALHQAIMRAHFQLMVWNKDAVPNPLLPSPSDYGWAMENGECSKERCSSNRYQCRRAGLLCTDLCSCSDDSECENQQSDGDLYQSDMDESDESDDDESSDE